MTTIKDFCESNNIKWFPVLLKIQPNKTEAGKFDKFLCEKKDKSYFNENIAENNKNLKDGEKPKNAFTPSQNDFRNLTDEQLNERKKVLLNPKFRNKIKHIAMDAFEFMHIDIDIPNYNNAIF